MRMIDLDQDSEISEQDQLTRMSVSQLIQTILDLRKRIDSLEDLREADEALIDRYETRIDRMQDHIYGLQKTMCRDVLQACGPVLDEYERNMGDLERVYGLPERKIHDLFEDMVRAAIHHINAELEREQVKITQWVGTSLARGTSANTNYFVAYDTGWTE